MGRSFSGGPMAPATHECLGSGTPGHQQSDVRFAVQSPPGAVGRDVEFVESQTSGSTGA